MSLFVAVLGLAVGRNGYLSALKTLAFLVVPLGWMIVGAWMVARDGERGFSSVIAATPGDRVEATLGQALGAFVLLVVYLVGSVVAWGFMNVVTVTAPIRDLAAFAVWGLLIGVASIGAGVAIGSALRQRLTPALVVSTSWAFVCLVLPHVVFGFLVTPESSALASKTWLGVVHLSPLAWALNALDLLPYFIVYNVPVGAVGPLPVAVLTLGLLGVVTALGLRTSFPWARDIPLTGRQLGIGAGLVFLLVASSIGLGAAWWEGVGGVDRFTPGDASVGELTIYAELREPGSDERAGHGPIGGLGFEVPRDEPVALDLVIRAVGPPNETVRIEDPRLETDRLHATHTGSSQVSIVELDPRGIGEARFPLNVTGADIDGFNGHKVHIGDPPTARAMVEGEPIHIDADATIWIVGPGAPIVETLALAGAAWGATVLVGSRLVRRESQW